MYTPRYFPNKEESKVCSSAQIQASSAQPPIYPHPEVGGMASRSALAHAHLDLYRDGHRVEAKVIQSQRVGHQAALQEEAL